MTLAQITKLDVYAWGYHLWRAGVKGAATAAKATMTLSAAGQAMQTLVDWRLLAASAAAGALWEVLDYLIKNPSPTADDYDNSGPTPIP